MKTELITRLRKSALGAALLTAFILSYGCAIYPDQPVGSEVEVTCAPPPPIVETTPLPPGPGYIWIGGEWTWRGNWVWEQGHYARPPRPSAVWVPHQYANRHGKQVFIRGGWKYQK